jgi:pimeloyl-ACP methyl ester carboxylesterase
VVIGGARDAPLNLVSVDSVMEQLFALMAQDFAGGAVHHLTSDGCPTVGQTLDAICDAVGVPRFDVRAQPFHDLTPVEAVFARRIAFYGSYLKGVRRFQRAQAGQHALTETQLVSLVARFVEGEGAHKRALRGTVLRARDQMPLSTYSGGTQGGETVVLVNALGMPSCVFEPLARALSPHARVLSWCARGGPELFASLDARAAHFERHVDDLEDLLRAHGVVRAHFVGFCTGADVMLAFAERAPERVQSMCAAHGALVGLSDQRTQFQQSLATIVRRAARSLASAQRFHGLTAEVLSPYFLAQRDGSEAEHALLETTVGKLDSALFHLTSAPFRTPDALHRYARLMQAYFEQAPRAVPALSLPALVICSRNDAVVHPQASYLLARALKAQLMELDDGSHFSIFESQPVIAQVVRFIREQRAESVLRAA